MPPEKRFPSAGCTSGCGRSERKAQCGNKDCKAYKDFHELLARKDIDAVCISTPDHWHSIPAIAAVNAGKDIFCEKPLSHTLDEGIAMVAAVEKNQRIWQTGSWQHGVASFRWAAELVQNGYIGKVSRVEVGLPSGHADFGKTGSDKPDGPVPAGVDYDMWTGPTKMRPFNPCVFHKNWRWNYNYGGGQFMDWIGPNGWVRVDRGKFEASDPQWIRDIQKLDKSGELKVPLYRSPGHWREFIDSVKSRKRTQTQTPVEIAHRSQTPGHLGYIASLVGRELKWDAAKQEIIGDAEATKLMAPQMRAP